MDVASVPDSTTKAEPASHGKACVPYAESGIKVMIRNAKFNFKYKKRKSDKPRLNDDDLSVIVHMLKGTRVTHTYDPETNDLCFDTHVKKTEGGLNDLVIDGEDTGGQVIRTAMSLAIRIAGARTTPLDTLQLRTAGKACFLYVQAAMYTLQPGESFTVRGGDPKNPDAPTFQDYQRIFACVHGLLGKSYELVDQSDKECAQFQLLRWEDMHPLPNAADWDQEEGNLDIYLLDQLLMALVFEDPGRVSKVTLRGDVDRDYHVSAMVKVLKLVGHQVEDVIKAEGAERVITVGT